MCKILVYFLKNMYFSTKNLNYLQNDLMSGVIVGF